MKAVAKVFIHASLFVLGFTTWASNNSTNVIYTVAVAGFNMTEAHIAELWPSIFAGGVIDEIWHNQKYVFAMSSRTFGFADEVKNWKEAEEIVYQNSAVNEAPHLYSE